MTLCNLEKTIIDNLVICYLAPTELLGWLKQTDNSSYGDFRMYRAEGRFHRHYFHLFTDFRVKSDAGAVIEIAYDVFPKIGRFNGFRPHVQMCGLIIRSCTTNPIWR